MKVFFDTSVSTDKKVYELFKKTIGELRMGLTHDWIKRGSIWNDKNISDEEKVRIYSETTKSILNADICFFDATIPSMRIGHEITLSIEKMKPTLVLINKNLNKTHNFFLRGFNSKFLTFLNYNDENDFVHIINEFIKKNREVKKVRLDVKINTDLNEFLDELSNLNKTSKIDEIKNILAGSR